MMHFILSEEKKRKKKNYVVVLVSPQILFPLITGELFTWGREEGDGRLGLGPGRGPDQAGGLSIPCKVKALPVPVDAVACGGFFTLALTEQGQLWSWGGNLVAFLIGNYCLFPAFCFGLCDLWVGF